MKKNLFVTAALLIGIIAGAMVFSSFAAPKQEVKGECTQLEMNVPTYWEGVVWTESGGSSLNIKVYQTEGMCNSFYAVILGTSDEVYVKNNPSYDPNDKNSVLRRIKCKYYITYNFRDYYFNM